MRQNPLKKLRREFVIVMMSIVVIFLMAIFSVLCISYKREQVTSSENAIRIAMDESAINNWTQFDFGQSGMFGGKDIPGGRMMDQFGDMTARTPVLVVKIDENQNITAIRNDMFYMGQSYIEEVVNATSYKNCENYEPGFPMIGMPGNNDDISSDDGNGFFEGESWKKIKTYKLDDYHLRYAVHSEDEVYYIAYIDESENDSRITSIIRNSILISLAVILLMFIISLFLSKRVLKPVEKAWDDQRRFVADASHELKTPLAVIISNSDMMNKSQDKNSDKNKRRLENIRMESGRMKELVNELLEVARGDISSKELVKEDVNLSELVDDEMLVWEPIYYEAGKSIESEIAEDIHINGDSTKLRRLIGILVDNALKYSNAGSKVNVVLSVSEDGHSTVLKVENKGTALTEEECKKIFERFYRVDASRESIPGYGLGLSIAVATVNEHDGKIEAKSDGVDTNTFIVSFKNK